MYFSFIIILYIYVFFINSIKTIYYLLNDNKNIILNKNIDKIVSYSENIEIDNVIEKKCNNHVIKLTNESVNCETLCGNNYIKKKINNEKNTGGLDDGVYCIPRHLDKCHMYAGIILKTNDNWDCISKYPRIFGGPNANKILACDGTLIENKINGQINTYVDEIPHNLIIHDDPETETINNNFFRFVCPVKYDGMNNLYISNDISRLNMIRNKCASAFLNDDGRSKPDFIAGNCICDENYINDPLTNSYCVPNNTINTDTLIQWYQLCNKLYSHPYPDVNICGDKTFNNKTSSALYLNNILISKKGISKYASEKLKIPL